MALKSVPRFFRKTAGGHFVGPIFITDWFRESLNALNYASPAAGN